MNLYVADMLHREYGAYPEPENCLVCGVLVDANFPHIFVRDSDRNLSDDAAIVGLVHIDCEQQYLNDAKAKGIQPPDPST